MTDRQIILAATREIVAAIAAWLILGWIVIEVVTPASGAETCSPPNVARAFLAAGRPTGDLRPVCPPEGLCWYEGDQPTLARVFVMCITPEQNAAAEENGR